MFLKAYWYEITREKASDCQNVMLEMTISKGTIFESCAIILLAM